MGYLWRVFGNQQAAGQLRSIASINVISANATLTKKNYGRKHIGCKVTED